MPFTRLGNVHTDPTPFVFIVEENPAFQGDCLSLSRLLSQVFICELLLCPEREMGLFLLTVWRLQYSVILPPVLWHPGGSSVWCRRAVMHFLMDETQRRGGSDGGMATCNFKDVTLLMDLLQLGQPLPNSDYLPMNASRG